MTFWSRLGWERMIDLKSSIGSHGWGWIWNCFSIVINTILLDIIFESAIYPANCHAIHPICNQYDWKWTQYKYQCPILLWCINNLETKSCQFVIWYELQFNSAQMQLLQFTITSKQQKKWIIFHLFSYERSLTRNI